MRLTEVYQYQILMLMMCVQVIKFVRKEKEVAVAKLEVVQAESERLKHQVTTTQRQLEEAKQTITTEREKAQVRTVGSCHCWA